MFLLFEQFLWCLIPAKFKGVLPCAWRFEVPEDKALQGRCVRCEDNSIRRRIVCVFEVGFQTGVVQFGQSERWCGLFDLQRIMGGNDVVVLFQRKYVQEKAGFGV